MSERAEQSVSVSSSVSSPASLAGASEGNSGGRARRRSVRPRKTSARFLMLWITAVLAAAAAFVVHLGIRFRTIDLGYQVGEERREQRRLIEEKRVLHLEAATLRDPVRIETIARGRLEMDVPEPSRVVSTDERDRRRPAGSVR